MNDHIQTEHTEATLPSHARLPINHCNLPTIILGSLTFQKFPMPIHLDGVEVLHAALFETPDTIADARGRAENFKHYMRSSFLLDHLDEAGFEPSR